MTLACDSWSTRSPLACDFQKRYKQGLTKANKLYFTKVLSTLLLLTTHFTLYYFTGSTSSSIVLAIILLIASILSLVCCNVSNLSSIPLFTVWVCHKSLHQSVKLCQQSPSQVKSSQVKQVQYKQVQSKQVQVIGYIKPFCLLILC